MDFRNNFLKPASLVFGFALSLIICLSIFSAPNDYDFILSFLGVIFVLLYFALLSTVFHMGDNNSFLSRFLRMDHREPFSFNRLMAAIGEILVASTLLAVAIAFSHYFESIGVIKGKVFLSVFTVLVILLVISFSITTILIHCLTSNPSRVINFIRQVVVGGLLITISSLSVNFGIASGKGVSTYYIQKYSHSS